MELAVEKVFMFGINPGRRPGLGNPNGCSDLGNCGMELGRLPGEKGERADSLRSSSSGKSDVDAEDRKRKWSDFERCSSSSCFSAKINKTN